MAENDFLIVGLGNPGENYLRTRHNVGYLAVDELARRWGAHFVAEKWQAISARTIVSGNRINLIKPTTYMNLSGIAVARYAEYFKIAVGNILVIHDDIDMQLGRLKLVNGGGAGGHNGIRSLLQSLSGRDFLRLKIGIGRPGKGDIHPDIPVERFVLSPFSETESRVVIERMDSIEEGLNLLFTDGLPRAMNLINSVK